MLLKVKIVQMGKVARKLTTGWRNSIIQTNTRRNFAHLISMVLANVNMGITAHLLILFLKYLLNSLISLIKILTFICFILKLYGALIMKTIIKETNVYSLIIGKILEESLNSISILKNNVLIGDQDHSLTTTKMDALMSTNVLTVMAGKNKNIIQKTTN